MPMSFGFKTDVVAVDPHTVDRRAVELLTRLLSEITRRQESGGDPSEALHLALGAIEGLSLVGGLGQPEAKDWAVRVTSAAGRPAGGDHHLSWSLGFEVEATGGNSASSISVAAPRLAHLKSTVVVNEHVAELRLVGVELYEDGVVVRWQSARPGDADLASGNGTLLLQDDLGSVYSFVGGGCFGLGQLRRGESVFVPGVPSAARELRLLSGDEMARVSLA
jgi:hypothetical protein